MITIAENNQMMTSEKIMERIGKCEKRNDVALILRSMAPDCYTVHTGGKHVAVCNGDKRLLLIVGDGADWK